MLQIVVTCVIATVAWLLWPALYNLLTPARQRYLAALLMFISSLSFLGWVGSRLYHKTLFESQVSGYILAARCSDSQEKALKYLDNALHYLEAHQAQDGFTSLVVAAHQDDLGEFYERLSQARQEVAHGSKPYQALEHQHLLETRHDQLMNCPAGISIAPYNKEHAIWLLGSLLGITVSSVWGSLVQLRLHKLQTCKYCQRTKQQLLAEVMGKLK